MDRGLKLAAASLLTAVSMIASAAEPVHPPSLAGTPEPGYASCAAFYFISATGKSMKEYDTLYRAGEDTLNAATTRARGRKAAEQAMETASGQMMKAIDHNWTFVDALATKYGGPCAAILDQARAAAPD